MFEVCGAEGVVRGEYCRWPLKVKVTSQKDGHSSASVCVWGGEGGTSQYKTKVVPYCNT